MEQFHVEPTSEEVTSLANHCGAIMELHRDGIVVNNHELPLETCKAIIELAEAGIYIQPKIAAIKHPRRAFVAYAIGAIIMLGNIGLAHILQRTPVAQAATTHVTTIDSRGFQPSDSYSGSNTYSAIPEY